MTQLNGTFRPVAAQYGTVDTGSTSTSASTAMSPTMGAAMNATLPSVAQLASKDLVGRWADQLVGTATVKKQSAHEVAGNIKNDIAKNPSAKIAISAALAQKYCATYKPDNPQLRNSLGDAINGAGLGHDVGLALWAMRKHHPNDPVLSRTKGADGKLTPLSASESFNWQADKSKISNEKSFYADGLDKLNNSRVQGLLDEIDFRYNPAATPNDGAYGTKAIEKLASLTATSPEWQTSNTDHFVSGNQQRIDLINAAKVVVAHKNAGSLNTAAGGDGVFVDKELKKSSKTFADCPVQSATIIK